MPNSRGFTLIELSIVLIVIGLVVGGVLVGRTLIYAAEIRSQIKQFQDYQIAFVTFQGKYGCIPGDCNNATTFFGTTDSLGNTINNGDGNGAVDTENRGCFDTNDPSSVSWFSSHEMNGAFQHLAISRMLDFQPFNLGDHTKAMPKVKIDQTSYFFLGASYNFTCNGDTRNPIMDNYQTGQNSFWFVVCSGDTSDEMNYYDDTCGIFRASDLENIDKKIDDGKPLSGKLYGFGGYSPINTNTDCLDGGAYKTSKSTPQCQAAFVIN